MIIGNGFKDNEAIPNNAHPIDHQTGDFSFGGELNSANAVWALPIVPLFVPFMTANESFWIFSLWQFGHSYFNDSVMV